jgi:hypothetical protein
LLPSRHLQTALESGEIPYGVPGSIPFALITETAAGATRNLMSALAASASLAAAPTHAIAAAATAERIFRAFSFQIPKFRA